MLVVLLVRSARRLVGPEMAYCLWAAPPLAALATLMPAPSSTACRRPMRWRARSQLVAPALAVWAWAWQ